MSIGPQKDVDIYETTRFDKVKYTLKKAGEVYFARPLYYLYYTLLTGGSVALLFNQKLPWQFYLLMALFTGVQLYSYYQDKPTPVKINKKNVRK